MLRDFMRRSDEEFEMYQGKQRKLDETQGQVRATVAALTQEKVKLLQLMEDLDVAKGQVC